MELGPQVFPKPGPIGFADEASQRSVNIFGISQPKVSAKRPGAEDFCPSKERMGNAPGQPESKVERLLLDSHPTKSDQHHKDDAGLLCIYRDGPRLTRDRDEAVEGAPQRGDPFLGNGRRVCTGRRSARCSD